jgi:hypothetical protein
MVVALVACSRLTKIAILDLEQLKAIWTLIDKNGTAPVAPRKTAPAYYPSTLEYYQQPVDCKSANRTPTKAKFSRLANSQNRKYRPYPPNQANPVALSKKNADIPPDSPEKPIRSTPPNHVESNPCPTLEAA